MDNIEIKDILIKIYNNEPLKIIDIRNNYEYQYGKIPTAKNINKYLLEKTPEKYLDKNKIYYIYCQSGKTSNQLVNWLNKIGYNTVNIIGGYNNYLLRK